MYKTIYLIVLFILMAFMLVGAGNLFKRKDQISRTIFRIFVTAFVVLCTNGFYVMTSVLSVANAFHSLYRIAVTWLLIFMLQYVVAYTQVEKETKYFRVPIGIAAVFDTVNLLLNIFFNHACTMEKLEVAKWGTFYRNTNFTAFYIIHLVTQYALILTIMALLFIKICRSPKMYRSKYEAILGCFFVAICLGVADYFTDSPIGIDLFFYCIDAIAVYAFSLYYVPRSLKDTMTSVVLETSNIGRCFYDIDVRCIYLNQRGVHMMRRIPSFPNCGNDKSDAEVFFQNWKEKNWTEEDKPVQFVYRIMHKNREYRYEFSVQSVYDRGEKIGYLVSCEDVTKETLRYEQEHYKATHDALTGLYNEQYFYQKVAGQIAKEPDVRYVMLTSDIKNFKLVNDIFGSDRGDEILKRHATLFRQYANEGTLYARLGSDRFAAFIKEDLYNEDIFQRAANVIEDEFANGLFRMQIKIGVYHVQDNTEPVFVMVDKCNMAISNIKGKFTQSLFNYDEALFQKTMERNTMINEFDEALGRGDFQIYLQPQTLSDGKVVGAEALVRWIHPEKGVISPGVFIPVFEQAGLIHRLDAHVWELSIQQLAKWRAEGHTDWRISVNISAQDQYYLDVYEVVTQLVEKYEVPPEMVMLEFTESVFVSNVERYTSLIGKLQNYGFKMGIDDFGSGYSSLNILKDILANELKIDMKFLEKTDNLERSGEIIVSVIDMGKRLNMEIVAEGVETEDQLNFLEENNCDVYQGYYFSRPIPVSEFEEKYGT